MTQLVPVVDRNRCEGKMACISVCPFDVFTMITLDKAQRKALSLRGRLKAFAHGGKQADVTRPNDCHACQKCVTACPESAITLVTATQSQ